MCHSGSLRFNFSRDRKHQLRHGEGHEGRVQSACRNCVRSKLKIVVSVAIREKTLRHINCTKCEENSYPDPPNFCAPGSTSLSTLRGVSSLSPGLRSYPGNTFPHINPEGVSSNFAGPHSRLVICPHSTQSGLNALRRRSTLGLLDGDFLGNFQKKFVLHPRFISFGKLSFRNRSFGSISSFP